MLATLSRQYIMESANDVVLGQTKCLTLVYILLFQGAGSYPWVCPLKPQSQSSSVLHQSYSVLYHTKTLDKHIRGYVSHINCMENVFILFCRKKKFLVVLWFVEIMNLLFSCIMNLVTV